MSELSFSEIKTSALACCEADDVREKLGTAELDQETIDLVVDLKSKLRVGEFTMAIFTALDTHRERLTLERSAIDDEISQVDTLLNQRKSEAPAEVVPELTEDLKNKLAIGTIDRDTFVAVAKVYGHPQNVAARTFHNFGRWGESYQIIEMDPVLGELMQDNRANGQHPLLRRQYFGPKMLDVLFSVADGYLTALDEAESRAQSHST